MGLSFSLFSSRLLRAIGGFLCALMLGLLATTAEVNAAPSYCTAIWGTVTDTASSSKALRRFNTTTNSWVTPTFVSLGGSAAVVNGLSGAANDGKLYFVDRVNTTLFVVNPLTVASSSPPNISVSIGTVPLATAPTAASPFFIVGATSDPAGNLFLYGTDNSAVPTFAAVAQISVSNASTLTSWTRVMTTGGQIPNLAPSGDLFFDSTGQSWIITNTTPASFYKVNLTPGSSFGMVDSPSIAITGSGANTLPQGASVNPMDGSIYFGTTSSGSPTFRLSLTTGVSTQVDTSTSYTISDMGNCTLPVPDRPTVSKTFNPTSGASPFSTTTLTINIGNSNFAPIWLNADFKDVLPSGMVVTSTAGLTSSGCGSTTGATSGNLVTTTVGSSSVTFSSGGVIPAGGCTISVVVRGSVTGAYLNTIPAGSLTTSSGTNSVAASAPYLISTRDFSVTKLQRAGSSGTFVDTAVNIPAGGTVQYQLTVTNSGSSISSGTVTFTDTLPQLITPVLSVGVTTSTGGNCSTATAVVGAQTQITGTFIAVPAGGQCIITITARGTTGIVVTQAATNAVTITGTVAFPDAQASNNGATVTTNINPAVSLSIAKTNGVNSLTAGQTTSYTITVVATAPPTTITNAMVSDAAATGLNCTGVTLSASGSAVTPTLAQTSIINLQGTGIPISFNPGSAGTATFVVTCGVTATGQ